MATKRINPHYCTFCNHECCEGKDHFSKTKRKTEVWWHEECYRRYKKLLGDTVSAWIGGQSNEA